METEGFAPASGVETKGFDRPADGDYDGAATSGFAVDDVVAHGGSVEEFLADGDRALVADGGPA
ncbi:hypothetical protein ACFQE1_20535, partial [Halobium palmae]